MNRVVLLKAGFPLGAKALLEATKRAERRVMSFIVD
jgi:hypothetical protein